MNEIRRAARWRRRRIIFNNDGDDIHNAPSVNPEHDVAENLPVGVTGETIDNFLSARIGPLIGTQVDSSWYNTCTEGCRFTHQTKVGEFIDRELSARLVEEYGRDSLQIQTDFCHQKGIEAFWSLRMNDTHDSYPAGARRWLRGLAAFKREHPEYCMGEEGDWEKHYGTSRQCWASLDFSIPEVREYTYSLIAEVAPSYDVDGIELDFLRDPQYFRPTLDLLPVEPHHVEVMTDLVRRVRKLVDEVSDQRGRPLLLAARIPYSVEDSIFIGLDVEQWLREDLIDILIPGGIFESRLTESFAPIIQLGHAHDLPVYPCIDWGLDPLGLPRYGCGRASDHGLVGGNALLR